MTIFLNYAKLMAMWKIILIVVGVIILFIAVFGVSPNKSVNTQSTFLNNPTESPNLSNSWTLVVIDNSDKRIEVNGYSSSKDCVEKGLSMSSNGEYFNCGYGCEYDSSTVDGIRCEQYCGKGGCATVPKL